MTTPHPAKFSQTVLSVIEAHIDPHWIALDPFAGVGGVHTLSCRTVGVELESEWADQHTNTFCWDALKLDELFDLEYFDAIVTSPCYGNRMADHHEAKERCSACKDRTHYVGCDPCEKCGGTGFNSYVRMTYRHQLGRPLSENSGAAMQWSKKKNSAYQKFHRAVWKQALGVLKPGGTFILNCSDHIRDGLVQGVTLFHVDTLRGMGCKVVHWEFVRTPRMGFGQNGKLRVAYESVVILTKGTT